MASNVPVIRPVAWLALLPQMALMAALATVGWLVTGQREGVILGLGVYLFYSLVIGRLIIARHHRRGIRLVRQRRFAEAIPAFEQSLEFFTRHAWVDRFRSIIMLSAAGLSYREMALANIAFCYSQIGRGAEAKQYYQQTLAEYPNNGLALAALAMIQSAEQAAAEAT
jgi:tetratricopeptide (TPR) repeat protein